MDAFSLFPLIGVIITIVVVGGAMFTVFRVIGGLTRGQAERERLLRTGLPARARVLGVQMGGMTVTVGGLRSLQLQIAAEIHVQGRPPYPAQITSLVSELQIPQVQPGLWMAVRIDPMNPQSMAIEATGVGAPGTPGPGAPVAGAPMGASPGFAAAPGYGGMGAGPGIPAAPGGGFGGAPGGGFGGAPGAGFGGAPGAGFGGAPGGFAPMGTPVTGFKFPLGAKIGLGVGLAGAVIGIGAAVMATGWSAGIGGPSDECKRAAACCRKMAGSSPAASNCDNYLKTTGPIADKVCSETLKGYEQSNLCK